MFYDPNQPVRSFKHPKDLPHWQQGKVWTFITWRLGDSIPQNLLIDWKSRRKLWLDSHPKPWNTETESEFHAQFSAQFENWLDQGMGSCALRDPKNSEIVSRCILHDNGKLYDLSSFVIMPNHVHLLVSFREGVQQEKIIQTWKSVTSHRINKRMKRTGELWQKRYWDRLLRSEQHFYRTNRYIEQNPVKAKLRDSEYRLWLKE